MFLWTLSSLHLSWLYGDQNGAQCSRCSLMSTEYCGMIVSLPLLVMSLGMQPRMRFTTVAAGNCWLVLAGCALGAPILFSKELPRCQCVWVLWIFCSRCRTRYTYLLKFLLLINSTAFSISGWIWAGLKQAFQVSKSTANDKAKSHQCNLQDGECRGIFSCFRLCWCRVIKFESISLIYPFYLIIFY